MTRRLNPVVISAAVEGPVDEAVIRRLIRHVGAIPGPVYGKNGKDHLRKSVKGYNEAARHTPWIVMVDLNHDAPCAPPLRDAWLPSIAPMMCFRVAVRAVEAWLLADRQHIARFLGVSKTRIPQNPEAVDDPKDAMVDLARHSRRRNVREDMVPRPGSGRKVGPAYTSRLIEFVEDTANGWRPAVAAATSDSLKRCIAC
ncbi:MAG: hypothetical protein D6723_01570, partial [Acidobacteria bacterium]